jgi:hypothetical protein
MVVVLRRQDTHAPGPEVNAPLEATRAPVVCIISPRLVEQAKARQALQIASPGTCSRSARTVGSGGTRAE